MRTQREQGRDTSLTRAPDRASGSGSPLHGRFPPSAPVLDLPVGWRCLPERQGQQEEG